MQCITVYEIYEMLHAKYNTTQSIESPYRYKSHVKPKPKANKSQKPNEANSQKSKANWNQSQKKPKAKWGQGQKPKAK